MAGPGPIRSLKVWSRSRRRKIDERPVILSVSGGKDSTALGLLLKEAGIPFRAVHMDTKWEHPETERYVREYLPSIFGSITILRSKHGGMEEVVLQKGMFPNRLRRFCTSVLKVLVFIEYIRQLQDEGEDPINAVGIRAAESQARANLEEWEFKEDFDCDVWRPLIRWSEQDVIDMHARHGVKPNPLYLLGASRVGCWPCIYARKSEIRLMAAIDPERVDRIRRLELAVNEKAEARHLARGETKPYRPRAWFMSKHTLNPVTNSYCMPIDEAVAWSRTKYGGKQVDDEPFLQPMSDQGCMRWGLCEAPAAPAGPLFAK